MQKNKTFSNNKLTDENQLDFICQVVNVIENKFASLGYEIENIDRDEAIANGENEEELAIIYGTDYYRLEDLIKSIITDGVFTADQIANAVIDFVEEEFIHTGKMCSTNIDKDQFDNIRQDICNICNMWNIT